MMTAESIPNPFPGEQGIRIEKAVRSAVATGLMLTLGDVLIELRMDEALPNEDFSEFVRALLEVRSRFEVEAWVMSIITGED
jgi:hypothetical protein